MNAALISYQVVAHNTAVASDNRIHDDAVARRFGFGAGLVPGVDIYAYLCHPPAEAWGVDWLQRGTMRARFLRPVYDGEAVTVEPNEQDDGRARLGLRNAVGDLCATAEAALPTDRSAAPAAASWPDVAEASERLPASPTTLAAGTALGLAGHRFLADHADAYLHDIGEVLPLFREAGLAHPGWLLRDANAVLSRNVGLGPWIHVESVTTHHRVVRDGQTVSARAVVTNEWEHKGHRFVTLDVAVLADGDVAARVEHTAIYAPRQATDIR